MAGRQGEGLNPRHGEDRPMDSIRALSSWSMAERRRGEGKESGRDTHSGGMRSCRRAEKIGGGEEGGGLRLIPAYALKSSLAIELRGAREKCVRGVERAREPREGKESVRGRWPGNRAIRL